MLFNFYVTEFSNSIQLFVLTDYTDVHRNNPCKSVASVRFFFTIDHSRPHHGILSSAIFSDNPRTPPDENITQSLRFILNNVTSIVTTNNIDTTNAICPTSNPTLNPNKPQPID